MSGHCNAPTERGDYTPKSGENIYKMSAKELAWTCTDYSNIQQRYDESVHMFLLTTRSRRDDAIKGSCVATVRLLPDRRASPHQAPQQSGAATPNLAEDIYRDELV